jgi:hypothetical protein
VQPPPPQHSIDFTARNRAALVSPQVGNRRNAESLKLL